MKKVFVVFFIFLTAKSYTQSNGCKMTWTPYDKAISLSNGTLYYAVQYSECIGGDICGWPQISLQHTFPYNTAIGLKLKGYDCHGNYSTASFNTSANQIPANQEYKNIGNWHLFKQVTEVIGVTLYYDIGTDHYRYEYDKEKGINQLYINNKPEVEFNQEQQQKKLNIQNALANFNNSTKDFDNNYNQTNRTIANIPDASGRQEAQGKLSGYYDEFKNLRNTAQQNINATNGDELVNNVQQLKQINDKILNLLNDVREGKYTPQKNTDNNEIADKQKKEATDKQKREAIENDKNEKRKARQEEQDNRTRVSNEMNNAGEKFTETIFSSDNLLVGSKFVKSNYGMNISITPLAIKGIPVYIDESNVDLNGRVIATGSDKSQALSIYGMCADGELYPWYGKYFYLKGIASFQTSFYSSGGTKAITDQILEYNWGGEVAVGLKNIKAFSSIIYGQRLVQTSLVDTSASVYTQYQSGSANYSFVRNSYGIIYHYDDETDEEERFVKFSYILEKPDYSSEAFSGYGFSIRGLVDLNLMFFPKYSFAGTHTYSIAGKSDKDMNIFMINVSKTFTLFNGGRSK